MSRDEISAKLLETKVWNRTAMERCGTYGFGAPTWCPMLNKWKHIVKEFNLSQHST